MRNANREPDVHVHLPRGTMTSDGRSRAGAASDTVAAKRHRQLQDELKVLFRQMKVTAKLTRGDLDIALGRCPEAIDVSVM